MLLRMRDLRESNEFLNALIDNINSAVFIVDKDIRIRQFNRALQLLFGKTENGLQGEPCGNAIGCSFAVRENEPCGHTSHCSQCELRGAVHKALTEGVSSHKKKLVREFFVEGSPVLKHLEYSTKHIRFSRQEMILIIVDDVTEAEVQKLQLIEKQKRIDEDLKAAAGIQRSLLPHRLPRLEGVEVAWKFLPSYHIGGDLFNVFRLDTDHLGCYMLDVSGHGVVSALIAVSASQSLQPSPPPAPILTPREVCKALDAEYPFGRFNTFFTMAYAVIDLKEGSLAYTCAGHPPLILLHRNGTIEELSAGGPVIGLGSLAAFEEERRSLAPGDSLVLYTDGVVEHRNGAGEFFGRKRLQRILSEQAGRPIGEILSDVFGSVMAFGGGKTPRDDLSLLGISFQGPA